MALTVARRDAPSASDGSTVKARMVYEYVGDVRINYEDNIWELFIELIGGALLMKLP